jgi:hypothetical protein
MGEWSIAINNFNTIALVFPLPDGTSSRPDE